MQLWMCARILGHFKEWLKDVYTRRHQLQQIFPRTNSRTLDDIAEALYRTASLENFVKPRDLDKPPNIIGKELVVDDPFRQLIPLPS